MRMAQSANLSTPSELTQLYQFAEKSELDQCHLPKSLHYSGKFSDADGLFAHMAVRAAAAYSPLHRSKTDLVYTTEDLRVRFVDRTHFFGRSHPKNVLIHCELVKLG